MARIKKDLKKYPKQLIENREQIESCFIMSLWQDPDAIDDYKNVINGKDIITEDGQFYYTILQDMYQLKYERFDEIAIDTFLSDKPELKSQYDKYHGYDAIVEMIEKIKPDNLEAYYDELVKSNIFLTLHEQGFSILKDIKEFDNYTAKNVYDYYDKILNEVCMDKMENIKIENLSEGYEEYIQEWDAGVMTGFPIGYGKLNYRLAGIHKSNLLLHLAGIGQGKTSTAILFYILPAIENGDNVCIIANEQGVSEFRQMILSTVVFNKIDKSDRYLTKLNRQKFIRGNFTEEDKQVMRDAERWLKEQEGKIIFAETQDYSIGRVKKLIKKHSRLGIGLFIFDTMKPKVESSERAWAEFSEVAKELFMLAKQQDVAIIATAQLSAESSRRRYLDLSCVGKSRAIAETATQVVMFRPVCDEEKGDPESNKKAIRPYNIKRGEDGKYTTEKEYTELDKDKDYIVLFTPKNRFGDIGPPIVFERNMAFNTYKEIGFCDITYDGFGS